MCYRCEICLEVSKPGQQMLRHVVTRDRPVTARNPNPGTETAREIAVCPTCRRDLAPGMLNPVPMSLHDLTVAHAFTRTARRERERRLRAERKAAEREALGRPRQPLLRAFRSSESTLFKPVSGGRPVLKNNRRQSNPPETNINEGAVND